MSDIDVAKYLEPVSGEDPCGEDLEYDAAFGELERAAQRKPEQRMGDQVIAAEEPQWRDVYDLATGLLDRSRDLRIAIHLTHAGLHRFGITALGEGLQLLHGLLDKFWDSVHPGLDEEDDNDPTIRMNCLIALNDRAGLIHSLNRVHLVESKQLGNFSLRDMRLADAEISPGPDEEVPDGSLISAAFMDCDLDTLKASADSIVTADETLESLSSLLREKVGVESAPDFEVLEDEIRAIRKALSSQLEQRGVRMEGEPLDTAEGGAPAAGTGLGSIQSREDAVRVLDMLSEYFRRSEPSSPVPLLLNRAKRLIAKDFMEILRDLAPDGVAQARNVSGAEEGE